MGKIKGLIAIGALLFCQKISHKLEKKPLLTKNEIKKFEEPLCLIPGRKATDSYKRKFKSLKYYQRTISRKKRDFRKNFNLELRESGLRGSAKNLLYRYSKKKSLTEKERDFLAFSLTLFSEGRNLTEESLTKVAYVINNRKKTQTYYPVVTRLAQFSGWYYKNRLDNVVLLCPGKEHLNSWNKVLKVAMATFHKRDRNFTATHYFAPFNMQPRYRIPAWAKDQHAVIHGGHVFLVEEDHPEAFHIGAHHKKIKVQRGELASLR